MKNTSTSPIQLSGANELTLGTSVTFRRAPSRGQPDFLPRMSGNEMRRHPRRIAGVSAYRTSLLAIVTLLLSVGGNDRLAAQNEADNGPVAGNEMVRLNFPTEIPIQTLAEYVSQRLEINILYDQEVGEQKVNVKAATDIPVESLLGVLESALKISGLALVDTDVAGWKKIVKVEALSHLAPALEPTEGIPDYGDATAATQAFVLKYADPAQVEELIKPFLSEPGGNTVTVAQARTLIVTDYATNLVKIAKWIKYIDRPKVEVEVEFVPVEHQLVGDLSVQLETILSAKSRVRGVADAQREIEIAPDGRSNQLMLIGAPAMVAEIRELVTSLDKPLGVVTKTYQFSNVRAEKIDQLARALFVPGEEDRLYRSVTDESENLMVVTAPQSVHDQIEQLRKARDVPLEIPESPVRFYKIKNVPVTELMQTLRAIEASATTAVPQRAGWREMPTDGRIRPVRPYAVPGANRLPSPPGQPDLPTPPAFVEPPEDTEPSSDADNAESGKPAMGELLGRARISGDIHTNSLIVVAEPAVQRLYDELIKNLDQPRPQVIVEAKFVIIDTSDDFSLGVEVSGGDRSGIKRLFAFSSYGLSTVDPVNGALSIIPGLGFNGTLVDPESADVVTRALVAHRRARVTSAPRILVSDNATGQLTSVEEVPFTSVNASQTVATTSFAGFADAGTTITVTPHIRDETSLQLDIGVTVNTFTGSGGDGVPPPRQTEEVNSQVSVPDGHTVILGGLNRGSTSYNYTGLPLLDRIPIIREATGLTSTGDSCSSMFIFIRPVILQDDKFKDLRYISEKDGQRAQLPDDYPRPEPIWIR